MVVKDNKFRRHKRSVGYLHVSVKYVFRSVSHHYCAIIWFQYSYISVFSCYTPVLLCGNSWSYCTLTAYRDGRSAKEKGKQRNISWHVLYPRLVSVYVNYSLGTPTIFQVLHYYSVVLTAFSYYHEYPCTIITLVSRGQTFFLFVFWALFSVPNTKRKRPRLLTPAVGGR